LKQQRTPILFVIAVLAAWSAAAVAFCYHHGWILYYGDAESHLNTARRILDSALDLFRQAGFDTRLVHPFTTKQYRQPADPQNKTDDTDLAAIFRAATHGCCPRDVARKKPGRYRSGSRS